MTCQAFLEDSSIVNHSVVRFLCSIEYVCTFPLSLKHAFQILELSLRPWVEKPLPSVVSSCWVFGNLVSDCLNWRTSILFFTMYHDSCFNMDILHRPIFYKDVSETEKCIRVIFWICEIHLETAMAWFSRVCCHLGPIGISLCLFSLLALFSFCLLIL
jgi:hypothetical protein